MKKVLAVAGLATLAGGLLYSQRSDVIRVDVKLVRMLVTVKNAQDQLVGSLAKEDFKIIDSGIPQKIATFEYHTEQPLSVSLLLDTSASTNKDIKFEVDSCARFLRAMAREGNPKDAVRFYTFNQDVNQQTGFTRDPSEITRVLPRLKGEAGTSVYDAIYFASEALERREGRHVIVIVSDGGDTTSAYSYQDALRKAHLSDAVIYSLIVTPITNPAGRNTGGEHALQRLSESTGGKFFFPALGPTLDATFEEVLRDLRTQYLITYYPTGLPESRSKFRTVQLELAKPGLRAFTRGGYYEE